MEFLEPSKKDFTIYSKSGCSGCKQVKNFLKDKNFLFNEINCDEYLINEKMAFLSFIEEISGKQLKSFPIVFYNGEFVGNYMDTIDRVDKLMSFDQLF
jgi:glutaredoxin